MAELHVTDFVSDKKANRDIAGPIGPMAVHRSRDFVERKDSLLQPPNWPAEEMRFDEVVDEVDEPVFPAVVDGQSGSKEQKSEQILEAGVQADCEAVVSRFVVSKCVGSGALYELKTDSRN